VELLSSAGRIAAGVREGSIPAVEVVDGALALTERQQPELNIATLVDGEQARERAAAIDAAVARGADPGPLAGVPVALKDLVDHAGRVTTCGSGFHRSVPDRSASVVARLEAAGAVVVSRTNLHEFAYGFSSENHWFGPVRNPLDPTLSPGGSSGGSAAAVAAGQVPIAVGTDTGGSVRVPAALCGVLGLKVTHGRVPLDGVFPLAPSLDTVGPIAGTVEDLALAYRVMAGHGPADPWSVDMPVAGPMPARTDLAGLRIGVPVPWVGGTPLAPEVAAGFAAALAAMERGGARVDELRDDALAPWGMIPELSGAEAATVHRAWLREGREYGPEVAHRLEIASRVTLDDYVAAQAWRAGIRQRFAAAFARFDLLATPATAVMRKPIGVDHVDTVAGPAPYRPALSWFAALVNSGGCPAVALPLTGTDAVPPPSLQLVAPWWGEQELLAVAGVLEAAGIVARPRP
jgi:Asp-tRNA(Asn)/Glu-tRNA(Gln) amidotransferase A subunit family amidase